MKTIITILCLLPCIALAQLPDKTEVLLLKLKEFETVEKAKVERVIAQKRAEVIKVLESYQEQSLRAKDLDEANAIQEKIDTLRKGSIPSTETEAESIVGRWLWPNKLVTEIREGGKIFTLAPQKGWVKTGENSYLLRWAAGTEAEVEVVNGKLRVKTGAWRGNTIAKTDK